MTWYRQAHCRTENPEAFEEPLTSAALARARRICAGCPVRTQCLDEALAVHDVNGVVRGGTTGTERAALLRSRPRDHARPRPRPRGRARRVCTHFHLGPQSYALLTAADGALTLHVITAEGSWRHTDTGHGRYRRIAAALTAARCDPLPGPHLAAALQT